MSAWEELGFELRLVFAEGEVEERFRERSQGAHPDSGGEEGVFERLREARNDLLNDFKRLELWLKAHGIEMSHSGNICLLYTSPSPRDKRQSRMPSSA